MKKTRMFTIIIAIVVLIITISIIYININKNKEKPTVDINTVQSVSEVSLNSKQFINSLTRISIKDTNDSIIITQDVKWEVPEHEKGETVSFSIAIPYTISVDGIDYDGIYELGDYSWSEIDNNPKYNLKITNLTQNGDIEILITEK